MGNKVGDKPALCRGLEIADFFGLLYSGLESFIMAYLVPRHHFAVVWGTDLPGQFFTPGLRLGLPAFFFSSGIIIGCVADRLKPGLADFLGLPRIVSLGRLTFLHQRCHAGLECVVEVSLFECDLARFPEILITLLLLLGSKLRDIGFVALCDIVLPAFFDLLFLHLHDIFGLDDTEGAIFLFFCFTEVNGTIGLLVNDVILSNECIRIDLENKEDTENLKEEMTNDYYYGFKLKS